MHTVYLWQVSYNELKFKFIRGQKGNKKGLKNCTLIFFYEL